jgi:hypothetical protein
MDGQAAFRPGETTFPFLGHDDDLAAFGKNQPYHLDAGVPVPARFDSKLALPLLLPRDFHRQHRRHVAITTRARSHLGAPPDRRIGAPCVAAEDHTGLVAPDHEFFV